MTLPGYFWDRWPYFAGKLLWDITTTQVNSALHPSGVAKSSTSFGWGKGGKITSAGWQVTLCDLIWHVISRIGVVISITNCYIWFTYLLYLQLFHLSVFTQRNFVADFLQAKCDFSTENGRFAFFEPPLGGLGATYDNHLRLIIGSLKTACSGLPISVHWTFLLRVTAKALRAYMYIGSKSAISLQREPVEPKF